MGGDGGVSLPPPNQAIQELASVLGDDATREIVRLFLHDFPGSVRRLGACDRDEQIRIAHGLKSSALHMGALALSGRLAEIEDRLALPGGTLLAGELGPAIADFGAVAPALRKYAEA
jgi:HPt (histidine-containing phosphotransfer) domain-containing protein